jgi:hypothetical protein
MHINKYKEKIMKMDAVALDILDISDIMEGDML